MRPSWDDYFLAIAETVALRADCTRSKVGAVIVHNGRIVSTGYNGSPPGALSCLDGHCPRGQKTYEEVPPLKGGYDTCIAIHAERNAILYAPSNKVKGSTIYVTREPCKYCRKLIEAFQIERVVWKKFDDIKVKIPYDEEPFPEEEFPAPSALIRHLLDWLHITYDELAEMTGVSRSALFYWRKTGVTPRANSVRQVMRLYSLAALLVRRFGKDGARRWLHSDGQNAWKSLKLGEIEQAEDVIRRRLFGQREHPSRSGRALSEEADFAQGIGANKPVKRAVRRPTRGRPGSL